MTTLELKELRKDRNDRIIAVKHLTAALTDAKADYHLAHQTYLNAIALNEAQLDYLRENKEIIEVEYNVQRAWAYLRMRNIKHHVNITYTAFVKDSPDSVTVLVNNTPMKTVEEAIEALSYLLDRTPRGEFHLEFVEV